MVDLITKSFAVYSPEANSCVKSVRYKLDSTIRAA